MFCGKCGFNNPDTAPVCQSCGAPLGAPAMAPPPMAYAPQPGYPQQAPYGYPAQGYQPPKPSKPFFDGPFNSPGWWETMARLASYVLGLWLVVCGAFVGRGIMALSSALSYYGGGSGAMAWGVIMGIFLGLFAAVILIAVVAVLTNISKASRENAAKTAELVVLKEKEAAGDCGCKAGE